VDDDRLIGTVLADRYRVESLIGVGAMGRVYRAEHVHMRKWVALKILHAELTKIPDMVQRFEQEAQAAAKIQHPHVAAATDFGKLADGSVYLALEYVEGTSLTDLIQAGPVPLRRVLDIAHQVSSALEVAHAHGIVHRDLKPDNLLLVAQEQQDFVKILDFGIAKLPTEGADDDKPLTLAGMVYGTPEYMAPEQALAQDVDGTADIYALGVIMFEMITGRRPYLGPVAGLLGQQLSKPLPKMSEVAQVLVPPAMEQLVFEMLSTDPKQRPSDVKNLREQIESLENAWDEGRLAGTPERSNVLLSATFDEVSSRLQRGTDNVPQSVQRSSKGRTSRTGILALTCAAVGVSVAVFAIDAWDGPAPLVAPKQLQTPPAPIAEETHEQPEMDAQVERAKEQGLQALVALAREFPAEGSVQAELALELAKAKKYDEALDTARNALALDPKLNEDAKIAGALFRVTQAPLVRAAGFRLLQGAMGAAGASIIYDLAHTDGVNPRVQTEALQLLERQELREVAAPPLLLVLELESKKTCEELKPLVGQAALLGDRRALPALEALSKTTGCGPKKQGDCYPCLRGDVKLSDAIAKIKQRATFTDAATD
jgi:eukaryotic-like serine/threonine-protein kinase